MAERGESGYQLIFIPWFWHDEYRSDAPSDWRAPDAFAEYGDVHSLDRVFIDVTGLGAGIYDRLNETGYSRVVRAVNFAQKPYKPDQYRNKRAEMWDELRQWLEDPAGVQVPDDDKLHGDLCAPVWGKGATKHDSNGRLVLEPKDHIRERLGISPDGGDAAALTFAFPVAIDEEFEDGGYDDFHADPAWQYGRNEVTGY